MNKLILVILAVFSITLLSSCSKYLNTKSATEKRQDIILAEMYKKYEAREIVFERISIEFSEYQEEPIILVNNNSESETPKLESDNSQTNIMYDGFGNKTETRVFFNHPLIKFIVVRTYPNGSKAAFVYAQNGEVKPLPDELLENSLILPPDEIAKISEIYEGRKENELIAVVQNKKIIPASSINLDIQNIKEKFPPNSAEENVKELKLAKNTEKSETTKQIPEK